MEENPLLKTLTITGITEEVKGVKTIFFNTGQAEISYKPGQYLTFIVTDRHQEVRRSYSITSAPLLHEPLSIGVKRVENGIFSRWLVDHAKTGDQLTTIGAGGFFILPANIHEYRQVFFLAAGVGITPVFSLLKTIVHAYPSIKVVLIYSNNSPQSTVYYRQLQQLEKKFPDRLHIEFIFSNSANLYRAHLHNDLLLSFLKEYTVAEYDKTLFYICGPLNYMRMCTYTLQRNHVPEENIRKENFNPQKAMASAIPPDTDLHQVLIRFHDKEYKVPVQYPATILQAAKKQGLLLPYSCEAGICGNCAARCSKGTVWLSHNEVLTEKEIAQGYVLTCVGFPAGGDAVISIGTDG
jgi:ring-1,2-phenylacetyl-CoA epoxidase subunit PaaE